MLVVSAILRTDEGRGDEFEQEFKKLAPKVLNDPGVIIYVLNRSINSPNKFLVYEKYESQDALDYHGSTPHFQEFIQAITPMLSGRAEVELYNEVA